MKLLFATSNLNKALEIQALLPNGTELLTLHDIELTEEIPETSPTLEGNALLKADYVTSNFNLDCFADDTGLEVECLSNEPGVRSARYAGEHRSDQDNINLVLSRMREEENRNARFRTVIALNLKGKTHVFEGIVNGIIRRNPTGKNGFGYDPIFEPENTGKTFAQMTVEEKNQYSHRARAFAQMFDFLRNLS